MSDLSATDLANMRADAALMWPDTCTIQTETSTVNSIGEAVQTWADTYTGVACRLDPVGAREALTVGRVVESGDVVLSVAYNQTVTAAMRVVTGGVTYAVIGVDTGKSSAISRRAWLRRVT